MIRPFSVARRVLTALVVIAAPAAGCADGEPSDASTSTTADAAGDDTTVSTVSDLLELGRLRVVDGVIVDDRDRTVLLRGANVNALGDYHQADPERPPTAPVTEDDWESMAAHGLSVVRLIISWSLVEPTRGEIDRGYLAEVREAVDAAARRGIYVVLDMHQDAWSKFVATPDGVVCPEGTDAAIGWDGAPEWATLTDGESTCRAGARESAPAVQAAFRNFYSNSEGIRDRLVSVWGEIATEFAGTEGLAGYELLNEPNAVEPAVESLAGYNLFVADAVAAIRAAEDAAGVDPALVFVEPIISYPLPNSALDPDVVSDPNLVFAPHNYAESIGPKILTVEQTFDVHATGAGDLRAGESAAALWIGEYGWWNTREETLDVARRFAAAEDAAAVGGAWWQWRQTCGDPHSVGSPGGQADGDVVHLITRECPADVDAGFTEPFLAILGRSYPRAAPGRIEELRSDPDTGALTLRASGARRDEELVVWLPRAADDRAVDSAATSGLRDAELTEVDGGRLLTATVIAADYALVVT